MNDLVVLQRLALATVLTGLIGYERERHGRAAGFRTHILVGIGSCLIMLTGLYLMETLSDRAQLDPTRLAAQVVSGIGFLGAGTILRFRASIRGLTTAASLWAAGGVGVAVGAGFLVGGTITTVIIGVVLLVFGPLERAIRRDVYQSLVIEASASAEDLARIRSVLGEYEVEIRDFDVRSGDEPGVSRLDLQVKLSGSRDQEAILKRLLRLERVKRAYWV